MGTSTVHLSNTVAIAGRTICAENGGVSAALSSGAPAGVLTF
jgi:hypothetical protein